MKILKWFLYLLLTPIVLFILFLVYSTLSDFKPDEKTELSINESAVPLTDTLSISFLSWNIGYGGLDKTMDFFYDGGEKVRPTKGNYQKNFDGILNTIKEYQDIDFLLIQEVDLGSKRSYKQNQFELIGNAIPNYSKSIGINYDVKFVPTPVTQPMGRTLSGLTIFSKTEPAKSTRYSFPGNYSWPLGLFMLDRCFLINEYPLSSGKNLIVISTHNSAYDDGTLRRQQMDFLKNILLNYYEQGDYVIAGGDWNQCPYGFEPQFDGDVFDTDALIYIDKDYPAADWTWAFDPTIPTNRRVMIPYEKGKTPTTLIDFFLCSPNIVVEQVKGRVLGFEFSDHQPVEMNIKLLP